MITPGKCVHFRGIQHETCEAGVRMEEVRTKVPDELRPRTTFGFAWPCMKRDADLCGLTCEKRQWPTSDEVAAAEAEWERVWKAVDAHRCPQCDRELVVRDGHRTRVLSCPEHGEVARECW